MEGRSTSFRATLDGPLFRNIGNVGAGPGAATRAYSRVRYTVKASESAFAGADPGRSSNWHHSMFGDLVASMLVTTLCLSPA
jgi:hypothetical protein